MDNQPDIEAVLDYAAQHIAEPARHNFRIMFDWFMRGGDKPGTRLLGRRIPGVDKDFAHAAERGIHVPAKKWFPGRAKRYAASINARIGSLYDRTGAGEPFLKLDDGTWVMLYSAHRNNTGKKTDSRWNDALRNNLVDMVPVGVFRQLSSGLYLRSLAWVESYDAASDTFVMHGPITSQTQGLLQPDIDFESIDLRDESAPSVEQLMEDVRSVRRGNVVIREGQQKFRSDLFEAYEGRCALSECEVPEVLQAAHIIDFHGKLSNRASNGVLLREDIHTLYDRSLLGIEPDSHVVHLDSRLIGSEYEELLGRKLRLPRSSRLCPNEDYLAAKFKNFVRTCNQVA